MTPNSRPRIHNEVYPFIHPTKYRGALKGKVAIITGAAGAIGQGHAESFAVAGARLYLVYNRTPPPAALEERCRRLGAEDVVFLQCNVSELESCERLVHDVVQSAGRVDILVNNAGANMLAPMHTQDPRDFLYEMAVNFNGPYCLMRLVMPIFREQRSGCVINIASRAGTVQIPWSTSYCASKAALINLTGCVQKEADAEGYDGIHLYSLHPGGVRSAMVEKKYSKDSVSSLPINVPHYDGVLKYYNDSMYLSGMVSVTLATGVAKDALRGKYFDVGQDLEDVLARTDEIKANPDMYALHTTFVGAQDLSLLPRAWTRLVPWKKHEQDRSLDFDCKGDHGYRTEVVSLDPLLIYMHNFVREDEAEAIVAKYGGANLRPSPVTGHGQDTTSEKRTSWSAPLPGMDEEDDDNEGASRSKGWGEWGGWRERSERSERSERKESVATCVLRRAEAFLGTLLTPGRDDIGPAQLVHYNRGQKFDLHHDWFRQPRLDARDAAAGRRRLYNRMATFFVVLEANCTRGETYFPLIEDGRNASMTTAGRMAAGPAAGPAVDMAVGLESTESKTGRRPLWRRHESGGLIFRPIRGNGLFWVNLLANGSGDARTLHAGLPVGEGTKTALNIWPRVFFGPDAQKH